MRLPDLIRQVDIISVTGDFSGTASNVSYDSENCQKDSIFVAVSGLKHDGHNYIPKAVMNGARFIVHEKDYTPPPGVTSIKVVNSRRALGIISKNFFQNPSANLCLVGVTGTNGKTTITYLMESILNAAGYRTGVLGTVNYRFSGKLLPAPNTTPESYEMQRILRTMADEGITHVISEVSSHALDLGRVDDCAFDIGIFSNLSQDHLDYHHTMENYFHAKKRFFSEVLPASEKKKKTAVINTDDPYGQQIYDEIKNVLSVETFGLGSTSTVRAANLDLSLQGIKAEIVSARKIFTVSSHLVGKYNLYNILAAVSAAFALGIREESIIKGLAGLTEVPGRLEKINLPGEPGVFVDYAHTEDALTRVLQNLFAFKKGKIITVFGCGGDRDRGKRPQMGKAASFFSDLTIITSDNPRTENPLTIIGEIEAGINGSTVKKLYPDELYKCHDDKAYTIIPDREAAIYKAIELAELYDIVLIAGKGHEDYQIVGDMRLPFDDRIVARNALRRRSKERRNGI